MAGGLTRLAQFDFPIKLNETTRAWLKEAAPFEDKQIGADMLSVASEHPDPAAVARLSGQPPYNAQLRTTCVATLLEAGHADNALPQKAQATINCRVLPGESIDEAAEDSGAGGDDDQVSIVPALMDVQSAPSPLKPEILERDQTNNSRILAGHSCHSAHEHGRNRRQIPSQRGYFVYGTSGLPAISTTFAPTARTNAFPSNPSTRARSIFTASSSY